MIAATDLTARTFRSALVGWCRGCRVYEEPYAVGDSCPMMCERVAYSHYRLWRGLVKRRLLICSECAMSFETKKGAEKHDCYSFY